MEHLCYVYVKQYKCLKDFELIVDCRYKYVYNRDNNTIDINDNKDFPENFWPEKIYSVTGIVGENGTGKSTIMSLLLEILPKGNVSEYKGDIIVIYESNGIFSYYGDVEIRHDGIEICNKEKELTKIQSFFYSGHLIYEINADNRSKQLEGCYNASDTFKLLNDYESYYNVSASMTNSMQNCFASFTAQNNYRICMMLANKKLSKKIKELAFPRYVMITINNSGKTAMNSLVSIENSLNKSTGLKGTSIKIPDFVKVEKLSEQDLLLSEMIYYNLLNMTYDLWGGYGDKFGFDVVDKWQQKLAKEYNYDKSTMKIFKKFVDDCKDDGKYYYLNLLYCILSNLCEYTKFVTDKLGKGFFYIDCRENSENLVKLGGVLFNNDIYLTSKFFDIYYAQSLDTITILSSGEMKLLNLFSRIYDAIELRTKKIPSHEQPIIVLLDEAEIGFHPEWQRRYLNLVVDFFETLEIDNAVQIIITTHSPLLLSDIPKCCTNYLRRDKNGLTVKEDNENIKETFAANVFNLYRMSFFMENGLVGEFASKKIETLNKKIEEGEIEGILNEINMIGDERIREFLMEKYHKRCCRNKDARAELVKYYVERIKQLTDNNHE